MFCIHSVAPTFLWCLMPVLICLLVLYEVVQKYILWLPQLINSILSMKVKHLVCTNHTSSSMILGYVFYNTVCFCLIAGDPVLYADHSILLSPMPFVLLFLIGCVLSCETVFHSVWTWCLLFWLCRKYLKCMLCLICIEMWFKVCLKNKIHC